MVDTNTIGKGGPLRPMDRRAKKLIVPELSGMPLRDATIVLAQAGFAPPVPRYVEAYAAENDVVGQAPARGQLVDSSTPVELSVAKAVGVGDKHVGKSQGNRGAAEQAQLFLVAADAEAGHRGLDKECRDAARTGARVGLGHDEDDAGDIAAGNP